MFMNLKNIDRYFYAIEEAAGHKVLHLFGNLYYNEAQDNEESSDRFAHSEWTGMYLDIKTVQAMLKDDVFLDFVNEKINYMGNINKEEATESCRAYFNGQSGEALPFERLTENTPCGNYYCDMVTEYTIQLTPDCFHPSCIMTIAVPNNRDEEEYIDEYLDSILGDNCKYNAEWDFYTPETPKEATTTKTNNEKKLVIEIDISDKPKIIETYEKLVVPQKKAESTDMKDMITGIIGSNINVQSINYTDKNIEVFASINTDAICFVTDFLSPKKAVNSILDVFHVFEIDFDWHWTI